MAQRRARHSILSNRDAEAGSRWHADRAVGRDLDRGIDQVWIEVSLARRDVTRE